MAIARRNGEVFNPNKCRFRDFQYARASRVGQAGLDRRQAINSRAISPLYAIKNIPHGRIQQCCEIYVGIHVVTGFDR